MIAATVDLAEIAARFGERLHAAGVAVTPAMSGRFAAALAAATPQRVGELFWLARVTLVVDGNRVIRIVVVSTGKPAFDTPTGSYRVTRKEQRSWSVPYKVWLPWASYFVGGVAFHEYPDVPPTPASHGCVRVPRWDAQ